MKKNIKRIEGMTLIEVLMALLIMTMVMMAIVSLSTLSIKTSSKSKLDSHANRYAQEAIEWLRSKRDENWDEFKTKADGTTWCINTLPSDWEWDGESCDGTITDTPFSRQVTLEYKDEEDGYVDAEVKVYWTDSSGSHSVKVNTFYTDWRQDL